MKSAVIIVHGIGPLDRYQIQDQFAAELRDALNTETDDERRQRFGGEPPPRQGQWHADAIWPPVPRNQELEGVRPSAVRVHCDNHGVDVLQEPSVDVFEAYWSPADKGHTNAFSVLMWMLRAIFSPVADTRIAAPALKTAYDIAFAVLTAFFVPALAIVSVVSAYRAYLGFETGTVRPLVALAVGLAGGYLVAQGLSRLVPLLFVSSAGRSTRRPWFLVALGLAVIALTAWRAGGEYFDMFGRLGWLLVTATSARLLLSLMIDFLDNRIGDIQIYSTHNENESFFALREKILQIVGDTALSVLRTKDGLLAKPLYDRVYLVGHSLGSSILMDVIIELHRLLMEGGLDESSWNRLRCFVSYGSALEKTHYLLGCARPNAPQQVDEFKIDLYTRLFSADFAALRPASAATRPPMFWTNYWYFSDVVANAIASYGRARDINTLPVEGTHYTCLNARLPSPPGKLWSHNYYLSDRSLWHSGGERRGLATILASS
ncbi:MAG TPA: hypothetical protein VFF60_08615 [Candidatus Binatus sp.]|nr:hypothetical protein [Candidatus Binatus sp.]